MDLGLHDRVYVVTGGTRGLGRATARALVDDGARVVVSSRNADAVDAAAAELGGGDHAAGVVADLADVATPGRLADAAMTSFGRLDGALISVGGPPATSATETTDDQWRAAFESVFVGALRLATSLAGRLSADGSIAFVLSSSVRSPIPGLAISNGLRPGLAMMAKTLADELGPRGVRVNGLLPGRINTDRMRELEARATDPQAARDSLRATIPLRRNGEPDEFGRTAAFLLSPAASYLSGVMLAVDGGASRAL